MKPSIILLLVFGLLSLSCSDNSDEASPQPAVLPAGTITLTNPISEEIFYFVVERETAALILWAPTFTEDTPKIAPLASIQVEIKDIFGIKPDSKEVVFYWWTADSARDGTSASNNIQSEVITL